MCASASSTSGKVRGISVGSRESFEAMNRAIEANGLKPVVDRAFAWTDAAQAIRYLKSFGKVVLEHG